MSRIFWIFVDTSKWRTSGGAERTPFWLRELDLNQRPFGYEPNELPGCSIPRRSLILTWLGDNYNDFLRFFGFWLDFGRRASVKIMYSRGGMR